MSTRTVEKICASGHWDRNQSADLASGTLGIAACFALVCLFLLAMAS